MTLYIVLFRNPRNLTRSHASLQLSFIDAWTGETNNESDEAPVFVIVIAVLVGGLISCTCLGIFIYMSVKAYRNRKKKQADDAETERLSPDSNLRKRMTAADELSFAVRNKAKTEMIE